MEKCVQIDKCFGFDTAVEEAQTALLAAKVEAISADQGIGLVKLMGRSSGFIAMQASMASGNLPHVLPSSSSAAAAAAAAVAAPSAASVVPDSLSRLCHLSACHVPAVTALPQPPSSAIAMALPAHIPHHSLLCDSSASKVISSSFVAMQPCHRITVSSSCEATSLRPEQATQKQSPSHTKQIAHRSHQQPSNMHALCTCRRGGHLPHPRGELQP